MRVSSWDPNLENTVSMEAIHVFLPSFPTTSDTVDCLGCQLFEDTDQMPRKPKTGSQRDKLRYVEESSTKLNMDLDVIKFFWIQTPSCQQRTSPSHKFCLFPNVTYLENV